MNRKKVIIIGPAHPFRGGIANFNNSLAQEYHNRGIDVQIFSFKLQYPSFLFPGKTQYEYSSPPRHIRIRTMINSINPFNWLAVARKINQEKPDYILVRYWLPFMSPCLGTICRLVNKNIKKIAITDNIIPHEKRIGDRFLTKYFVKSCNAFITLSRSVLDDLSLYTDSQIKKFMPHPIYDQFGGKINKEDALSKLGLTDKSKYLLFFGFIRKYKGLDLLLEAMSDVRIKELGIKLIVAGEFYDDEQFYYKLMNNLKIRDNIIIRDTYIPEGDVKDYFCGADIITQTYHTATQSGVTQIAYHFERPMLVTDVGGLSEIVIHNKVGYVTDHNPHLIADCIVDFYSNSREQEFVDNIILEKERFSWSSFVDGIEEFTIDVPS